MAAVQNLYTLGGALLAVKSEKSKHQFWITDIEALLKLQFEITHIAKKNSSFFFSVDVRKSPSAVHAYPFG